VWRWHESEDQSYKFKRILDQNQERVIL